MLAIRASIAEERGEERPLEIALNGTTPGDDPAASADKIAALAEAGLTWWLEGLFLLSDDFGALEKRIGQGPPRE